MAVLRVVTFMHWANRDILFNSNEGVYVCVYLYEWMDDHPAVTMYGCQTGVAPQWLTIMKKAKIIHRFSSTTLMHLFSQHERCTFMRLNSKTTAMMKKKSTMRKEKAVPVTKLRGKSMRMGKMKNWNSSILLPNFSTGGSSSATAGGCLAISSKFKVLSSPLGRSTFFSP